MHAVEEGVYLEDYKCLLRWRATPLELIQASSPIQKKPTWDAGGLWLEWSGRCLDGMTFDRILTSFGGHYRFPMVLSFLRMFPQSPQLTRELAYADVERELAARFGLPQTTGTSSDPDNGFVGVLSLWRFGKVSVEHHANFDKGGGHTVTVTTL